jgi:hypothetical protein
MFDRKLLYRGREVCKIEFLVDILRGKPEDEGVGQKGYINGAGEMEIREISIGEADEGVGWPSKKKSVVSRSNIYMLYEAFCNFGS